jgi:hypothetical protein
MGPGQHSQEGHGRGPELLSWGTGAYLFQRPDNEGRVLSLTAQDIPSEVSGEGLPLLGQNPHLGPVRRKKFQVGPDDDPEAGLRVRNALGSPAYLVKK